MFRRRLTFTYGCELPVARMALRRTLTMLAGSCVVGVREVVENLAPCDVPFTMCQHVSFSAPFVEPGATVNDLAGSQAHTFPGILANPALAAGHGLYLARRAGRAGRWICRPWAAAAIAIFIPS